MKIPVLLPVFLSLIVSCSDEATSQQNGLAKSNIFAVRSSLPFAEDLKLRLSIIAPLSEIEALHVVGTKDSYGVGLATSSHKIVKDKISYLEAEKFLPLKMGKRYDDYHSELLEYTSLKPIGNVRYQYYYDAIERPAELLNVCTGPYEHKCTLSYNSKTKVFEIQMLPE